MRVGKDASTPEMIKQATAAIQLLTDEVNSVEHPFRRCDRDGTKRRASSEIAMDIFTICARVNDLDQSIKNMENQLQTLKDQRGTLVGQANSLRAIRDKYEELA